MDEKMKKLKKKFYTACEDLAKLHTYDVRRMTQEHFNQVYEATLKASWVFMVKNMKPKD